jgi:hypothetical protein
VDWLTLGTRPIMDLPHARPIYPLAVPPEECDGPQSETSEYY